MAHKAGTILPNSMEQGRTFFDTLPEDALRKIVYFFESYRREDIDFSLLFSDDSVFRTTLSSVFTKAEFSTSDFDFDVGERMLLLSEPKLADVGSVESQCLKICGPSIETVKFYLNGNCDQHFKEFPVEKLIEHCPGIKALEFEGYGSVSPRILSYYNQLIRAVGPRLRILRVDCSSVECLDLSQCCALEELHYFRGKMSVLAPNWRAVGQTLRKLSIGLQEACTTWPDELKLIGEHAKNLQYIDFLPQEVEEDVLNTSVDRYAQFLASYGENLIYASTRPLECHLDQLKAVVKACPSFEFQHYTTCDTPGCREVAALGSRLKELIIDLPLNLEMDFDSFRLVMKEPLSLRKLLVIIGDSGSQFAEDVVLTSFSSSRHALEEVKLIGMLFSQQTIQSIASHTSNLKVIDIVVSNGLSVETACAFRTIVTSNPQLKHLILGEDYGENNELTIREIETDVEIVEQFAYCVSGCRNLSRIFLNLSMGGRRLKTTELSSDLRDRILVVCRRFRNRGVEHSIDLFADDRTFSLT